LTPAFVTRDSVRFGFQVTDRPFGRVPDGSPGVHVLCLPTPGVQNVQAPLGNRNRLRFNEWMPSADTNPDWFEIYNPEPNPVSLGGLVFSDRTNILTQCTNKATVTNSWLEAGGFLRFKCDDKANTGHDELDFKLASAGEAGAPPIDRLTMFLPNRSNYIHRVHWTNAQTFYSYGYLPDGNTNDGVVTFLPGRDTPGESNFLPIDEIVINEILAHTDPPLEDAIELYNQSNVVVDISGWWLSDDKDVHNKFRIPNGTVLNPGQYIVFYEYVDHPNPATGFNTGGEGIFPDFSLSSSEGDQVYLFKADPITGKLTGHRRGVDFPASANGVSFGRYITSTEESDFIPLATLTFGTDVKAGDPTNRLAEFRTGTGGPNAGPLLGNVVITEVMYHPPDIISGTNIFDNELDEYVEIYNCSTQTVYLYDRTVYPYPPFGMAYTNTWRVRGEIDFNFPTNVSLLPGRSLILVNFGLTNIIQLNTFRAKYSVPPGVQIFGAYGGKLSNGEGTVEIERPDAPQPPERPDAGFVPYIRVDKVRYDDDPPWPIEADGVRIIPTQPNSLGYTLSRKLPDQYGGDVTNWMAAVPSVGRQRISSSVSSTNNEVTVSFLGWAGSGYTVQYRDELGAATWLKLQDFPPQTNSGPRQVVTTPPPGAKRFHRVVTPMQP